MAHPSAPPVPSARAMLAAFAMLAGVILALFAVDTLLAALAHEVRGDRAAQHFAEGRARYAAGNYTGAIEQFHVAVSADRSRAEYRRGLAAALLAAGNPVAADSLLVRLLRERAGDGEANLLLARARARQGRISEAISHYRRAIHGEWSEDAADSRVRARLELIELLARRDARRELLAELLPLETAVAGDSALRRRTAHLYLQAGAPSRAAAAFRELIRQGGDADAFAGLGRAEFEQGNYRIAEANYRRAAELRPTDPGIAESLKLIAAVRGLDPTLRGLGSAERLRRARELLRLTVNAVTRCVADPTPPVRALLDSARAASAERASASARDEALERQLALAERLNLARGTGCPAPTLDLVIQALSR
jgi:Flp pilus assembly protein TadD